MNIIYSSALNYRKSKIFEINPRHINSTLTKRDCSINLGNRMGPSFN